MAIRLSDQIVRRLTVGVDASYTNQPHQSYDLYVKGNTLHNGIIYVANGTTYYINNSADSRLRDVNVRTLGITQTDGDVGYGISLYGGPTTGGMATYGMSFAHTSKFGKIQNNNSVGVTSDWATYLTMSDTESRGWIFRRGSTNVAGIDGRGSFVTIVSTGTHIKGLTGEAVAINMAAAAGYNMLARIKSSNGRFNIGVYNRCLDAIYGADTVTSNTYTHGIVLLAENGVTSLKYLRVDGANHVEEAFDMAGYIARFHGKTWVYGPLHIGRDDATANTGYATANVGVNNYIAFYGVYGDNPGSFNHTYIGERIWGPKGTANEQSELLLFHGNDAAASSGPDRIRAFAGAFKVDVFTTTTSGAWMDVGNSANAIQGFYVHGTDGIILGNTTARSNGVNQTTINGHLVINGAYNTNNSYSEGIRINKSSNNWSVIQMGGATGSTTGTGDGQYLFGVNPSGYAYWSHNGSDSAASRIQGHKGNGWSIRPRLYVNTDAGTGYNFYVNGTSYFTGNVIMAATTESTSSTTGTLRVDGGVGIGKDLNARSLSRNGDNYVLAPGGGYFTTTTSSYTGALKITMPVSWTNTMMDFFVDIYDYNSQKLATYHLGGYNYASSSTWVNTSAYCIGIGDKSNLTVRFGHDGSKCCVTIGETNTTWSYPQVTVRGFSAKYSGTALSNWENGWSISFVTTLPTVKSTIELPALMTTGTANRMAWYKTAYSIVAASNIQTDGSYLRGIGGYVNGSYAFSAASAIINSWIRTTGSTGWYNESYGGGWYMTDANWLRNFNSKPLLMDIGTHNGWGIGGHRLAASFVGSSHVSILLRSAAVGYGWCVNTDGNWYYGRRTSNSDTSTSGDTYLYYGNTNGILPYATNTRTLGDSSHIWSHIFSQWLHANRANSGTDGGVSLYNAESTYAIMFRTTANQGKHGDVDNDWATYFTMSNTDGRGWIFKRWGGSIAASISTNGTITGWSIASSWIDGQKNNRRPAFHATDATDAGSFWPWFAARNTNRGRLLTFGNLSDNIYLMSSPTSRTSNGYDRSVIWSMADGHLWIEGGTYHQMIQLNTSNAECSIAYNGNSGNTNWVVGRHGSNFGWWNSSYWVMDLQPVGRLWVGRNANDGERQIGVDHSTSRTLYMFANNGEKGIYSGAGQSTGYLCRINGNGKYHYGGLVTNPGGYIESIDNGTFTYHVNSGTFDGNSGWCHYLICNHGNGASYYHYTIGLPFWGVPRYKRQTGSTSSVAGWYDFITTENPGRLYWANIQCSTSANTGTQPTFNTCYTSNWFRSTGATGWYSESYGGGIWMQDSTYVRVYNNKHFWIGANLYVSQNNTTGNGIYLADDGSIVDNNDGFCTMRFTYGVYITAGKNNNTVRMGLRYDGWIYFYNSGNGLYWPNCNGAHLYANSGQGTYGALVTQGARNGYNGLHFGNNGNYMTVMDNSNDKGLFQQGVRWILWYNRSADRICIGGSNNSGWFINLNGNTYCYGAFYSGDVRGGRVRVVDNWVGFYQSANAGGARYGYIQADGNRMYFRKENGASGNVSFDFGSTLYCAGEVMAPTHMRIGATILRDDGSHFYFLVGTRNSPGNNWNSLRPFYFNLSNGYSYHTRAYSAVWNDYAEFRKGDTIEPGRCVIETKSGVMTMSTERLQPGAKIISDTYGQAMGETKDAKTPIAVSGRVLVYPYRDRKDYELGSAVCAAPNGTVDIMTREEIMMYPERIVGTVSEIPTYDIWHSGGSVESGPSEEIKVNGRIWIYVR